MIDNFIFYNFVSFFFLVGVTRLSLDFRIIPYHKYIENIDFFTYTKFDLNKYYIVL
jgi:hypothetical protein